ncbi:MAG: zinc-binding dehydrogenase [Humidesulfovibrio sp.]|nr:zinc-binding dehydrogenase [Humidesulfovibrio sp.]
MQLPKTMKAAILVEQNRPLVLAEVGLPESLECGQVLVKVLYSGICGSQLGEISGVKGPDKYLPHLLGHEASAEVLDVGPGVRYTKPGDLAVLHWRPGRGLETIPPKYTWNGAPCNAGFIATFNQFAIVAENRLTVIPGDFDPRLAPLFGCAVTTGVGVVENNAKLCLGESIVVFGAGGVGLNVIQAASLRSAHPIIAIDLHANRLELAARLGATHCLQVGQGDLGAEIRKIAGPAGVDVAVDNTGDPKVIEQAYSLTKPQGRVILVGVPRANNNISIYSLPLHFGKVLTGSHGGECRPELDIPRYIELHKAGKMQLTPFITDEYPLERINEALEDMRNGKIVGRCLIRMHG